MTAGKKLVAFTLYDGVMPLDVVGPLTVLRKAGISLGASLIAASQGDSSIFAVAIR
jgi:hypothetical protein